MGTQVRYRPSDGLWARAAALLVSGWLIVSAIAFERGSPRIDGVVVGYLVFVCSMVATAIDEVRVLNTALGVWMLVTAWVWPAKVVTLRLNETLVGVAIGLLSLVSNRGALRPPSLRRFLARLEGPRQAH
jgi:hypothetical protein